MKKKLLLALIVAGFATLGILALIGLTHAVVRFFAS